MEIKFSDLKDKEINYLLEREFLVTNGLGSYAASTVCGANTRKYHGLLVSASTPPTTRKLLFSRVDEIVTIDGIDYQLATNQWQDETIAPQGYKYLTSFTLDPYPCWEYQIGEVIVTKKLIMVHGQDILQLNYSVSGNKKTCTIKLILLVNYRDFHNVTTGENNWYFNQVSQENGIILQAFAGAVPLCFKWSKCTYERTEVWYKSYLYNEDKKRVLAHCEDNYNPGSLTVHLEENEEFTLTASTEKIETVPDFHQSRALLEQRMENVLGYHLLNYEKILSVEEIPLLYAADQFIVKRESTAAKSVIAGYHWFSDWGRDALISLTGLTLVTSRFNEAKSIIRTFTSNISGGLLPNNFPDNEGIPDYNSVDVSLWLFVAAYKYLEYTEDDEFIYKNVYQVLKNIIESYLHGTGNDIKMDHTDSLITSGNEKTQLTWMDARVDDKVITPRTGKPVEISLLWYNALRIMELFAERFREEHYFYSETADKVKKNILKKYWNKEKNCLFDVIFPDGFPDDKIRPNQIFALSLPFTVFPANKEKQILKVIEEHLLTPYGLRTLSPSDPDYNGVCEGNALNRDSAYHQGTVWPWLLGPFISSYLRVNGRTDKTVTKARKMLGPLLDHLNNNVCLGSVSEIFNGNEPYNPGGCVAQAWSVAELLRCLVEDIYDIRPDALSSESNYIFSLVK